MSAKMNERAGCGTWCRKHSPVTDVVGKLMNGNHGESKKGHSYYSEHSKKWKTWVLVSRYHPDLVSQPFFIILIKAS